MASFASSVCTLQVSNSFSTTSSFLVLGKRKQMTQRIRESTIGQQQQVITAVDAAELIPFEVRGKEGKL